VKYGKLILRNILRNKRRTFLTVSSLGVSLFLIVTLATIFTELTRGSSHANPLRLIARHAVSLVYSLPVAYVQRIESVPGVKFALPYSWFGGIYKDERNFFANFAIDAKKLRPYLPEINMSDEQWDAFIRDRQGAIVGRKLVERFGFHIGQRITLKSPIYRIEPEMIIRGIYSGEPGTDEKTLFFHTEYFNESLPAWQQNWIGTIGVMANAPEDVPRIARQVDSMFLNTDRPTKTENEREFAMSFETMMGGVKQFLYGIMLAITFSILLVMANTMAMNVRERTNEVGTLKALGFQRGAIAWMFVAEAILLSTVGALLGVGGATLLFSVFDVSLYLPNFGSFIPARETVILTSAVALLVGVASVSYSAYRVSKLTIVEALRRVE
jgi:putative ABC transport system permease protein